MEACVENNIAIIGGTGLEALPADIFAEALTVETRYGSVPVLSVSNNYTEPHKLYFLSRHGPTHGIAPHLIDYRANTEAMVKLGVKYILASNAVGSLRRDLLPGSLLLFNDFIDFTRVRGVSYFDNSEAWQHIDFSMPYSLAVRTAILECASEMSLPIASSGTYVCVDGPRFETPAEVCLFANWGGDVVGMTGVPEVVFAREAGVEYAAIGIVTNLGAGLTSAPIQHNAVASAVSQVMPTVLELLMRASGHLTNRIPTI